MIPVFAFAELKLGTEFHSFQYFTNKHHPIPKPKTVTLPAKG
jgi:hypothetical protein